MSTAAPPATVAVIIPTLDEAGSIAGVIARVPRRPGWRVIVADNGSVDGTAALAAEAGATVVEAAARGYGHACLAGVRAAPGADVLVFLDGDGSMAPEEIPELVAPILDDRADVVCGVRPVDASLMPLHQRLGNRVIGLLLRRHGVRLPELCPFRAIRGSTLRQLDLPGSRFAWPAQMLARAAQRKARITPVAVSYRDRTAGRSKVGGSLRGSLAASWDIARTLVGEPAGGTARR
jgi:glycosyltransferase involved in cell wall biosynthesis